ncbi:Tetratricopeptide repeat protein 19, mitochondrial [Desmophyllum pertusum]|uniref:Tetratricopeptide repeat protein 19, mitochondrial n=1 Tax=Desmophyllum pertusum TaxID=174260 RepID=A0A9X0D7T5_9CNID|nr:Tetratricopeptide repeat protein 19, mitochondrial [Desmophyllum pertusum]
MLLARTFISGRLQCSNLAQDSSLRRIRRSVPDELWALLIVGLGGIAVFTVAEYKKVMSGKKQPPVLQYKVKMAKKKALDGDKGQSIILLKEALGLIHDYLEETREDPPGESELDDKDKIKIQKYLTHVLDQLANLSFELQKWKEAEHYFRLLLRNLLSSEETPKDDDGVIEVSLKLSIACAHQDKHDLAVLGFKWATDTIQKKVDETPDATDNSKALLGVCLEGWGTYLLSQDEAAQAAQLLSRALKISKEVLGEDHEQTTVILNNLAKAYAESGKFELAEELAREAVRIAEETQNTHLSRFMANLGTILNLEGNVLKAKEALRSALKLANEAKDEETKEMINNSLTEMDANASQ